MYAIKCNCGKCDKCNPNRKKETLREVWRYGGLLGAAILSLSIGYFGNIDHVMSYILGVVVASWLMLHMEITDKK